MSVCKYCKHRNENFGEDSPNCWSQYHACFEPEDDEEEEQEAIEFAREFMSDAVHETAKLFRQEGGDADE